MKFTILALFFLASCNGLFGKKSSLEFRDLNQEALEASEQAMVEAQRQRELFEIEKKESWDSIVSEAKESFETIRPIIERKCFDCHDSNTKLPLYARALPGINPLAKHQRDGIAALDFSDAFPLKASGTPTQVSLLKAIKHAVQDRTMPIKMYTTVYRSKKISEEDQIEILNWIDPLIEKIEDYQERFENKQELTAQSILENKCFRCHANGVAKGGFGDLENKEKLLKSKFINHSDPEGSEFYKIVEDGRMPPSKRNSLTQDELILVREWLKAELQ